MRITKRLIYNMYEYILVFSLIIHSRSIWSYDSKIRIYFTFINIILLAIGSIGAIGLKGRLIKKRIYFFMASIFVLLFVLSFIYLLSLHNLDGTLRLFVACALLLMYCICCINTQDDFINVMKKLYIVIFIVVVISLVMWFFGSILHVISPSGTIYSDWNNRTVNTYYGIYYEPQTAYGLLTGNSIIRNCAFFTEAPMCSFVFSIGLLIYEYILKGKSLCVRAIFYIGIFSTICSTGYIILLLLIALKIVVYKPRNKLQFFLKLFSLVASSLLLVLVWTIFMNKLDTMSGNTRVDDFFAGYKAWRENPIFGNGIENLLCIQQYMSSFRLNDNGFSNSIMQILSDGGVALFILYLFSAFVEVKKLLIIKDYYALSFVLLFLLMFSITLVSYTNLTVFFFCLFYSKRIRSISD